MTAVGTEAQIARALLQQLRALTLSPALPVDWPDVEFPGKDAQGNPLSKPTTYLEARLFQAPTETVGISETGFNAFAGFLQVTLITPQGAGAINAQQIATQVITQFKRGTVLTEGETSVKIIRPPYVNPSFLDAPSTRTPVTIRYIAFARQT